MKCSDIAVTDRSTYRASYFKSHIANAVKGRII